METTKVAGTIILTEENGEKKFLVAKGDTGFKLILSPVSDDKTALASILSIFKEKVQLDVDKMNLVDLTNALINKTRTPLFVFEMNTSKEFAEINNQFSWESPSTLRSVLQQIEITETPYF